MISAPPISTAPAQPAALRLHTLRKLIPLDIFAVVHGMQAEAAAYDLRMKHLFDGEDFLHKALEEHLRRLNANIDAENTLASVEAKRFEAYIDYLLKIGKLTPQQATLAKDQRHQAEDDYKEHLDETKAQAAIDAKKRELAADVEQNEGQFGRLNHARNNARQADDTAKKHAKDIEQEKDKSKDMEADAVEAEKHWEKMKEAHSVASDPNASISEKASAQEYLFGQAFQGFKPAEVKQEAKGLRSAADFQKDHVSRMEKDQETLEEKVKSANKDVETIEKRGEDLAKAIHDLTDSISTETKELADKKRHYQDTRAEGQRSTQANEFYQHGPLDQESRELFNTQGPSATQAALAKVIKESTEQIKAAKHHQADDEAVRAATAHIVAIFASHAEITTSMIERLLNLEQSLNNVHTQLQVNTNASHL